MVLELTRELENRAVLLGFAGSALRWQGSVLIDDADADDRTVTELTTAELRLLRLLVERAPAVLAKADLAEPGTNEHAVESVIGRLRTKLGPIGGGIRTVRRRGYGAAFEIRNLTAASPAR